MSNDNFKNKGNKLQGLLGSLNEQVDQVDDENHLSSVEANPDALDVEFLITPTPKPKIVAKTFTIREDQIKTLSVYAKKSKKGDSEFLRDALDFVFANIKNSKY